MDALTGRDLCRWFPLTSPSDFLYFLPPRRGVDTAKKLRLISSAAGLGSPLESLGNIIHGFTTTLLGSGSTSVVSFIRPDARAQSARAVHSRGDSREPCAQPWERSRDSFLRRVSANGADHYRAVPLSDGYHILFTDPCSGNLCLGTDAPVGALTRLLRKVWFSPPANAASPVPILYTAGADVRHGVRIVATFAAQPDGMPDVAQASGSALEISDTKMALSDYQIIMFYTIPPDMFQDIARASVNSNVGQRLVDRDESSSEWVSWRPEDNYYEIDIFRDNFNTNAVYPLEVRGQAVAVCSNLVDIALDSSPDVVIWAFSAEGWARTWAMDTGGSMPYTRTMVQSDGSLRYLDFAGDVIMAESDDPVTPSTATEDLAPFDGASTPTSTPSRRWHSPPDSRFRDRRTADRMSGTVSVELVEEVPGISRVDVELR